MQKEYVTTNIRLPEIWHRELKRRAVEDKQSLAELVRGALEKQYFLRQPIIKHKSREKARKAFWKKLLEMAEPMGGNIASNIDEILYGKIRH